MNMYLTNSSALQKLTERSKGHFQAFLYDCDGTLADTCRRISIPMWP